MTTGLDRHERRELERLSKAVRGAQQQARSLRAAGDSHEAGILSRGVERDQRRITYLEAKEDAG
jgi:hypothetical protein